MSKLLYIKHMDDIELFGLRVRQLRKDKMWSQERLAYYANLNRSYIGAVERGEKNISIKNIFKIAVTLGVDVTDLFHFVDLDRQ